MNLKQDNVWDTGYNATINIFNTSDSIIENWCLTFLINETMLNIWNATISKEYEDYDGDGLSILEEYNQGTEPLNPDTDEDGILDGDERFLQTYTYEVENQDCAVKEVYITLEGTGNLQSTTDIESVMNKDALCTGVVGLVEESFSIETTSEFDNATITFKIDEVLLWDTDFENLMFLWYNEEEPAFVELETILDKENMTVSVKTTHFSKYMVVDKKVWQEAWATELNYKADNGIDTYYTVLAIDCSGSMKDNDPIINNNVSSGYDAQYNAKTCNRIEGALEFVDNRAKDQMGKVVKTLLYIPFVDIACAYKIIKKYA